MNLLKIVGNILNYSSAGIGIILIPSVSHSSIEALGLLTYSPDKICDYHVYPNRNTYQL